MIHSFLNFLVDELKDQIFQFAFKILLLKHLQQRGVYCTHAVVTSQSQVCEILAEVVHHNDFVFEYGLNLQEVYVSEWYLPPST